MPFSKGTTAADYAAVLYDGGWRAADREEFEESNKLDDEVWTPTQIDEVFDIIEIFENNAKEAV